MDDNPVRFTTKDVISLGTIAVMIAIQWGFNSSRVASAEEKINKLETSDKEQAKDNVEIKIKLNSIEKDTQQVRKDLDELKSNVSKVLDELKKK